MAACPSAPLRDATRIPPHRKAASPEGSSACSITIEYYFPAVHGSNGGQRLNRNTERLDRSASAFEGLLDQCTDAYDLCAGRVSQPDKSKYGCPGGKEVVDNKHLFTVAKIFR